MSELSVWCSETPTLTTLTTSQSCPTSESHVLNISKLTDCLHILALRVTLSHSHTVTQCCHLKVLTVLLFSSRRSQSDQRSRSRRWRWARGCRPGPGGERQDKVQPPSSSCYQPPAPFQPGLLIQARVRPGTRQHAEVQQLQQQECQH